MAGNSFTSSSHLSFPQVFKGTTIQELQALVQKVPTHPCLADVLDQAERRIAQCDWDDGAYGCSEDAVVHHLQSELEFCLSHFQKWVREGREL